MNILFLFVDGIGLGQNDPSINPFAKAYMPVMSDLLDGRKLVNGTAPKHALRASLLSLDANLGVKGVPQSATGQAALLTGRNIPEEVGFHFGPWPNQIVVDSLKNGSLFSYFKISGLDAALLNAYPSSYFEAIESGRRIYSAVPQAAVSAGISLKTMADLKSGQALSADFTAEGWRERLNIEDIPTLTPFQAGEKMVQLTKAHTFSFFEYWLSDYAGHGQDMEKAVELLETFDKVLEGMLSDWDFHNGLVILTSDHGNMEDLSTRRHTTNRVPCLLIAAPEIRRDYIHKLNDITDIAPAILESFDIPFK